MIVDFRLDGKVALVTGASRGIGASIAKALAEYGAEVIITNKTMEGLPEVEEAIKTAGGKAVSKVCHNGVLGDIENLFKFIASTYGKLDILVNNAAMNFYFGNIIDASEDVWNKTMEVNLKGTFFMCQYGARLMMKNGGGSIINVASINGIRPAAMQGVYSITKAGVIALTKSFAKELAHENIRVNALLPGLTDTKFTSVMIDNEELMEKVLLPQIPLHRAAQPDEMCGAVIYLASDASSYTTGATIVVDGGALA
ncbi:MAG: glucose 1-dehydrogenase [Syntrophomonadaceae bacterium]|jgi:NAD(P)-dependent dehydrogenase (short-subunit alcohol dehydrogenase family)|nr:glucose 1-dehydrogenase [Bacillota bacterium]HOQ10430.1 glucose 1-dehydrogenase [Syntrophomonadaceae bacterium]HPU49544.1 glucose 1-dehydrogenase [Syntrophomonadaceae bacterium]HQA08055.1 glucose 1-dehydrogenase [Syntrophomonadaceae bacterium]